MVFSSTVFLFLFLPLLLLIYFSKFVKTNKVRNIILLISSLVFYAYGEPIYIFLMIVSIVINYLFGLLINKYAGKKRKICFATAITINIAILVIFKYLNFIFDNLELLINKDLLAYDIILPIGISFYTFQIMSYIIDVYRGDAKVQKNLLYVALYVTMFPQLVAGPIVRYDTIADEIENRKHTSKDFSEGVQRFIFGLGKKVILSNYLAIIADNIFGANEASVATAWLGAIAYTLQIYFDFSGYSDMAIGLGRVFGFHFEENFNYPYIANSITDFWRRWHISLSKWFKEYVYIPLGGNRVKRGRMIFNIFIVWLLTGIWHGANWTFIAWGIFYFILLLIEKLTGIHKNEKFTKVFGHIYAIFFVIMGWVFFRSENIQMAISYIGRMFGMGAKGVIDSAFIEYMKQGIIVLIISIIAALPIASNIYNIGRKAKNSKVRLGVTIFKCAFLCVIFILSIAICVSQTYNPFIYFNF